MPLKTRLTKGGVANPKAEFSVFCLVFGGLKAPREPLRHGVKIKTHRKSKKNPQQKIEADEGAAAYGGGTKTEPTASA